jgi:HEAT repeat protein
MFLGIKLWRLRKKLHSSNQALRLEAIQRLGQIPDVRAVDALIQLFQDADLQVRFAAIETVLKMAPLSTPLIVKLLEHPVIEVVELAASLLPQIRDPETIDSLITCLKFGPPKTRRSMINAIKQFEKKAIPKVREMQSDSYPYVRIAAEEILQTLGEPLAPPSSEMPTPTPTPASTGSQT